MVPQTHVSTNRPKSVKGIGSQEGKEQVVQIIKTRKLILKTTRGITPKVQQYQARVTVTPSKNIHGGDNETLLIIRVIADDNWS